MAAIGMCISLLVDEYLLELQLEQPGEAEGYWEARVELPGLDSVDRLSGDAHELCHVGLCPGALGTEFREAVLHRYLILPMKIAIRKTTPMKTERAAASASTDTRSARSATT